MSTLNSYNIDGGQMIKRGIVREELVIDSVSRRKNGLCPFMPEEVGLLLRALGYPEKTIIYLAGSETFGGQRVLVPLRAMYTNLVDRTTLCSKEELSDLVGPEYPLPHSPPAKSKEQLLEEWNKGGPRPRPLPPPPARPFYLHEHQGWYGWVVDNDKEPEPSPTELRMQAHWLLRDALDYYVSVEADAFFPGFQSDFSSLVMGHRLYQAASSTTYRTYRTSGSPSVANLQKGSDGESLYGSVDECPEWVIRSLATVSLKAKYERGEDVEEGELVEEQQSESDGPTFEGGLDPDD